MVQCWLSWVQFWVSWFSVGSVLVASGSVGEMLAQFGSWLVLLVQFRFGEVSVHVEDDVQFSCGSVCFSVGSGGSVLVLVWFNLVQVGSVLVQFWCSLG